MRGLFLKDWYVMWKIGKATLFLCVLFTVIAALNNGNMFYLVYPGIITGMFPMTLMAYEEKEKWNVFAQTLPFSRKKIVSEKYIFSLIMNLSLVTLVAVSQAIAMTVCGRFVIGDWLMMLAIITAVMLFTSSVYMPFVFKVGVEKARLLYYFLIGILCSISTTTFIMADFDFISYISGSLLTVILLGVCVIIYAASWMLSVWFYNKRQF